MYKERKNQELEQAKGSKFEERLEVSVDKDLRSKEKMCSWDTTYFPFVKSCIRWFFMNWICLFSVTFAEEHARKARGYEAKLQEKIQERQQVFEDAFKEEIENYKRHGKTQS